MSKISGIKRIYYAYIGWVFSFTYRSRWRQILGFPVSSWLKFLSLGLFFAAFGLNWGLGIWGATFLLMVWIWGSYWRADKLGYMRFVAEDIEIPEPKNELSAGERANFYASGTFAVANREEKVLLRPCEYWRSALGEHGLMVNEFGQKYLYQFFKAEALEAVQPGWMIFGSEPLRTVAVTFWQTWGPENADDVSTYTVGGGEREDNKRKKVTIYLTFEDTDVESQVMQKLMEDAAVNNQAIG